MDALINLDYQRVVLGYFGLLLLSFVFGFYDISFNLYGLYLFVCIFIMRYGVRLKYAIPGGGCSDCCASFFCAPCVLTQLQHQLWTRPARDPGCNCGPEFAHVV